jgi:hypothetical protein
MGLFANQGTFGVETDNNFTLGLILWIELIHILWIWWQKGHFVFRQNLAIPATVASGIFHTFHEILPPS